jgi:hypothetical protein
MSTSFMPSMLQDETGYNTEGNRGLETGWSDVCSGLKKMLVGNILQLVCAFIGLWLLLGLADVNRMLRSVNGKADWNLIVFYAGVATVGLGLFFSYIMVIMGQWRCLAAPERKLAKALMFASMLCILAAPVLNFLAGWTGGMDAAMAAKHTGAGGKGLSASDYMGLASGILGMLGNLLFIFFLRACADCFDNKILVWCCNLYLVLTGTIILVSLAIAFNFLHIDLDPREISKGLRKGDYKILMELGLIFYLLVASLISYVWYLLLLWLIKSCIENGVKKVRSPLAPQPW